MKFFLAYIFVFNIFFISYLLGQVAILNHILKVEIVELKNLNTKFRECNLSVSPNGSELYFMSTRVSNESFGQGDIYKTNRINNNAWENPSILNAKINTNHGEDEPSVSLNGKFMYYQSWKNGWENDGGPYYKSEFKNGHWQKGIGLGGGINQFFRTQYSAHFGYATDGMAVSPDGKLFIVACGSDYSGNMDLYFSQKINEQWTFPKLFKASTPRDERSVFIAADSKTVYFSSNGHGGFGGMDLFKTTFENGTIHEIINIGAPFNTEKDDMGFVISGNGNSAFLIRDLDIYFADLTELDEDIKPVKDSSSNDFDFAVIDKNNDTDSSQLKSIEIEEIYKRKKEGSLNFVLDVLFNFDSFRLNDSTLNLLEEIRLKMINKTCLIVLEGHTDNEGTILYNQNLSIKRVDAVKDWFHQNGIQISEVIAKGETQPKFPNNSSINKFRNRRVVISCNCN